MTMRAATVALHAVLLVLFLTPSPAEAGQRWEHPLPGARIGQCYGGFHRGVDMFHRHKHRVVAARRRKVVYAGWNDGYGKLVVVVHGSFYTAYGHLNAIKVRNGQRVGRVKDWVGRATRGCHGQSSTKRVGWVDPASDRRKALPCKGLRLQRNPARKAFVVKRIPRDQSRRNAAHRRRRVAARHRLAGHWAEQPTPMLTSGKITYELRGG